MVEVRFKKSQSPFRSFDWSLLDSSEFKEDSVREELITPLLWAMGYSAGSGVGRIVRSRRLEHPYVSIGATQHKISLVPDYLMTVRDRPAWIMDAKSPTEAVCNPRHEAQAYSYACHRDVRVEWYAVCNGREFAAFHVADMSADPRIRFQLKDLAASWDELFRALGPLTVLNEASVYLKDFGIHLTKMGLGPPYQHLFLEIPVDQIGRVGENLYSLSTIVHVDDQRYFATFDFQGHLLEQLRSLLTPDLAESFSKCLQKVPSLIQVANPLPENVVALRCIVSDEILENDREHYVPLNIREFRRTPLAAFGAGG